MKLRIYDNGGKTADRYTIIPPRSAWRTFKRGQFWECIGCNAYPFHPQGIGMHCEATPGPHLGKRAEFSALPADVQKFARQSFPEFF